MTYETTVSDGVCRVGAPGHRFLSTGFDGGERVADAAFNVTVPEGFDERDLRGYARDRLDAAGFDPETVRSGAPVLLTGVDQRHARRAQLGPVEVVATAGLSNPAALPVVAEGVVESDDRETAADPDDAADREGDGDGSPAEPARDGHGPAGTVNLIVVTGRDLAPGALANLVAVAAEAKAATLLATTGFPGTTSDAVVVASDPDGERGSFSGSATAVGAAARACVRDAVVASLRSRYGADATLPESVDDAAYGVVTDERATVSRVAGGTASTDPAGDS